MTRNLVELYADQGVFEAIGEQFVEVGNIYVPAGLAKVTVEAYVGWTPELTLDYGIAASGLDDDKPIAEFIIAKTPLVDPLEEELLLAKQAGVGMFLPMMTPMKVVDEKVYAAVYRLYMRMVDLGVKMRCNDKFTFIATAYFAEN